MLGSAAGYYLMFSEAPSKEITYMDFLHTHLLQKNVEMITICEDKSSSSFSFRAKIKTKSGEAVHLILPQVEKFV
jgi:hypothetical protein